MKNRWSDKDARAAVARLRRQGVGRDLALRLYTTRLLGAEPTLVSHGGGNTSVKTVMRDVTGEATDVLCVKASGHDMATIGPEGMPAVRLEPLRRLIALKTLDDEDMAHAQRGHLLDARAPTPSVEFLLHAFLPHKFVDHTHADAVLALTNQPAGRALCESVFGDRAVIVPYVMSGFALAKRTLRAIAANPGAQGAILLKHGIFTFGGAARESYGRMIGLVSLAESRLRKRRRKAVFPVAARPRKTARPAEVAPVLRGLTSIPADGGGERRPFVLAFRTGPRIRAFVDGAGLARYARQGPATPDHVIRVKPKPLIVPPPEAGAIDRFTGRARRAVAAYQADYGRTFARNNRRHGGAKTALDPMPRIILVPGLGLFGLGRTAKDAAIAADLAETNVAVITGAESIGRYQAVSQSALFDIEYWSPERAKLEAGPAAPLAGSVAVVTGGASGIGAATARAFAARGAAVAVLDLDAGAADAVAAPLGGLGVRCDVTHGRAVRAAFDKVCAAFGGVDIVVSNAGAAWQGAIAEVSEKVLRKSFELNFWAHQRVAQNAVRVMRAQGMGGCLLFNASKQAVNPGPDFGPYGLPKAATLFLMRQYAVDHGGDGIRANAVNADRVRSGLLTGHMIAARARARGVSEADYMAGNLLRLEVTSEDVAEAFVALALAPKTTAAVITVDGGNIAAALR